MGLFGKKKKFNTVETYNQGVELGHSGNFEEAISCYKQVIDSDSNHFSSLYNLGVMYGKTGRHEEALQCHVKTHEIAETFEPAVIGIIVELFNLEQYDKVVEGCDSFLSDGIGNTDQITRMRDWSLKELGRENEVSQPITGDRKVETIEQVGQEVELSKEEQAVQLAKLGKGLAEQGNMEDAVKAFKQAIELDPHIKEKMDKNPEQF